MKILELTKDYEHLWDEWVEKSNETTFYHQIGWRNVVEKTYNHDPIYLIAEDHGELLGLLPLFYMKSILFGSKLVSIPFASYGGVCTENEDIKKLFLKKAIRLTNELNCNYLELRNLKKTNNNLIEKCHSVTMILELNSDPNIVWGQLAKDRRRDIKRAEKRGLVAIWDNKKIREFYYIYTKNMRRLGTPSHSFNFFSNILLEFPNSAKVLLINYNGKMISGAVLLLYKDSIICGWSSALREYVQYYPNNLLFWEAIKYGCEKGYKYFDFGRSVIGSGPFEMKKRFGAKPKQLYYCYYLNKAKHVPDLTMANPKRQIFAKLWQKVPQSISNKIGHVIRRNFP